MSRFQHDRGAARASAVQMQPVPTHINQLARHGIGPRVERLTHGLITAAYRGNTQRGQYQVDQPPRASAAQLPPGLQKHPDDQPKQCWRPHPTEQIVHSGGPAEQSETDQRHKRGRRGCPPLGLIGKPDGQHSQQRPTESKAEQNRTREGILLCRDERGGDKNQGNNQSSRQRSGDDQPDASSTRGLRASGFLEVATVLIRPGYGGLNSIKVDADASLWPASVPV